MREKKESLIKMVYVLGLARRVEFDRQNEKKRASRMNNP